MRDWDPDTSDEALDAKVASGRLTPELAASIREIRDTPPLDEVRTVTIEPEWNNTAAFFATGLRDHAFDRGKPEPVVSFIEQVRYLTQTDLPAIERLIARVQRGGR